MASVSRRALFALATSERFERVVRAVPGAEAAAYRRARRYVAGRSRSEAFAMAQSLARDGLSCSIDCFGESVSDPAEADRVTEVYIALAGELRAAPPGTFLSLDLSHVGIDAGGDAAAGRVARICAALPDGAWLQVGAEEAARADRILEAVLAVSRAGLPVAATVQANLVRSRRDAARLAEAGVPIRLVKGAYVEDAGIAVPWGEPTDLAFLELAHEVSGAGGQVWLATHDPVLREALVRALPGAGVEMLLGVHAEDARALAARGVPVRVYVPYGEDWFRYAMRRLAESRGA